MASATQTLISIACAIAFIGIGAFLLRGEISRTRRVHTLGWAATVLGYGWVGVIALAFFTGRFGPQNLWFRAPLFYACAALLLVGAVWWFSRPLPPRIRFGLPAAAVTMLALAALLLRVNGRSAPLAMLMPTMSAPAPELTYFDDADTLRKLSELQGNVVLLNFWATWCTPCRKEMPLLSRMQREYSGDGFVVLYVSLEDPEVLGRFLAANHFDGIQGRLDRAADFYNAGKFYPLSYLIGRDGVVAERWSGRPEEHWLTEVIRKQLAAGSSPQHRSARLEHDVPAREQ